MARPTAAARIMGFFLDKNTPRTASYLVFHLNLSEATIQSALDTLTKDKTLMKDGNKYSLVSPEKTQRKVGESKAGRGIAV